MSQAPHKINTMTKMLTKEQVAELLPVYLHLSPQVKKLIRNQYEDRSMSEIFPQLKQESLKGQYVNLSSVHVGRYRSSFADGYQYTVTIPEIGEYPEVAIPFIPQGSSFSTWIDDKMYKNTYRSHDSWI